MYCSKCGKQNSDNAKFCAGCGCPLYVVREDKNNDANSVVSDTNNIKSTNKDKNKLKSTNVDNDNSDKNSEDSSKKVIKNDTEKNNKVGKKKMPIIIILVVVVIIIVAVLKLFVFNNTDNSGIGQYSSSDYYDDDIYYDDAYYDDAYYDNTSDITESTVPPAPDFVFPDSNRRLITYEEVLVLDDVLLRIAINEIYARHGRIFKDEGLNAYFNSKSWYKGLYDVDHFNSDWISEIEMQNLDTMNKVRQARAGNY